MTSCRIFCFFFAAHESILQQVRGSVWLTLELLHAIIYDTLLERSSKTCGVSSFKYVSIFNRLETPSAFRTLLKRYTLLLARAECHPQLTLAFGDSFGGW